MSYILRYSRLFSLGNFENEKIELERQFEDETPKQEAILELRAEVLSMHNNTCQQRLIAQDEIPF